MGYVLKKIAAGAGDATAANQVTQIAQLTSIEIFVSDTRDALLNSTTSNSGTLVISFIAPSPALLATQIQTFLQGNVVTIISICYADAGGIGANPHSCIIVYKF